MKKQEHYCISKEEAEKRISEWQKGKYVIVPPKEGSSETNLQLDSFLVSIEDFKHFLRRVDLCADKKNLTGVVCRIGIKPNPAYNSPVNVPCLIFEAVEGFSSDPLNAGKIIEDLPPLPEDDKNLSARYDFSYPCPPTCPTS